MYNPDFHNNHAKLVLGTVQFGLNYGINNQGGKPSLREIFDILDLASAQRIEFLDTAEAYGDAIEVISQYHRKRNKRFEILSKFKYRNGLNLDKTVKKSLYKLGISYFDTYSLHSFRDYIDYPHLTEELRSLKDKGLIKKIGISIYLNTEFQEVITDKSIDVIQLPFNILDNQNIRGDLIAKAKLFNKEIHIRSIFLQGLFFMDESLIPPKLLPILPYLKTIKTYCITHSLRLESVALSYALYNKNIDRVLIGVDTQNQLLRNIESICYLEDSIKFINRNIRIKETELLNPINWK